MTLEKTTTQTIMDILENRYLDLVQLEGHEKKKVTETTLLKEELGMDSLDRYEFTYVEEALLVTIPDEVTWKLKNVRDYANYADAQRKPK